MSAPDAKDVRRAIQKRTFTKWINVYLSRHDPPTEVCDLFQDIQDGRILMTLLEELTGCKLLYRFRSSSLRIFRLNNISKALAFLDDRHVKLLGIDASAVADGVPSVVLNLIWNIILHFQVKEMNGGLHRRLSSSLSSLSMGSELTDEAALNPGRNTAKRLKYSKKTIKSLLHWVQRCTTKFGVEVLDFGRSWRNGLAFLALIKSIKPDLMDLRQNLTKDPEENLEQAFRTAQQHLDIPPLLEPRDVTCSSPDEKSIITYVSMFLRYCPDTVEDLSSAVNPSHISKFRSLETLADKEEAQPVFSSLETSHELLLWKRWARRSSNSLPQNKRRSSSVLQPPSPLDAIVVNPEIQSWLAKSLDYGYSKTKTNETHFSLSSEEGTYSVTPLDSDEEDAYSYILDLNRDTRQVPRVEEEADETEETGLIGDEDQAEMFAVSGNDLNGDCKEESATTEQKGIKEMQDVEMVKEDESPLRLREERFSMGGCLKSENIVGFSAQKRINMEDYSKEMSENTEKEERTEGKTEVGAGYSKKEHVDDLHYNDIKAKIQKSQRAHADRKLRNIENSGTSRDFIIENLTENMNQAKSDLKKRGKEATGEAGPSVQIKRGSGQDIVNDQSKKHVSEAKYKHGPSDIRASERGVLVQAVAPSRGLNWTELHLILFLWMLLYCYFIGKQFISY